MKHYTVEGDLVICNTWFGVAEMQMDFGLFKDLHMIKFIMEIEKIRVFSLNFKTYLEQQELTKAKESAESFAKENNISVESILDIFKRSEEYMKYIDDLPNLVPDSLKGKKLILTGLQTNAFSGPKIIQL